MVDYIAPTLETDPDDISADALAYLEANIPGFAGSDGHLEVWQIYALARIVAEAMDTASAVPLSIFRYFGANLVGIQPIDAVSATIPTTWVVRDNAGYTIKAGTQVAWQLAGDNLIAFTVENDVVIAPGSNTTAAGAVTLLAVAAGSAGNGLGPGAMVLLDPLAYVASVTATAVSAGGVDAEDDSTYLSRLIDELALLTPRPIFAADFAVLARSVAGVHRATAVDNYNPPRTYNDISTTNANAVIHSVGNDFLTTDVGRGITGPGIPAGATILSYQSATQVTLSANATATAAGVTVTLTEMVNQERMVAVAAVDAAGVNVSGAIRTNVQTYLDSLRELNFIVNTFDATHTVVNVTFQYKVSVGYDPTSVQAAAAAAVTDYLNPATWGVDPLDSVQVSWTNKKTVSYNDLIAALYSVTGLASITSLLINGVAADLALPGAVPLPTIGAINGTLAP